MRITTLLIIAVLLLPSCLDQIDLGVKKGFDETIVIDGKLTIGAPSKVIVVVSRLFDFLPSSRTNIRVSEIFIRDEDGNELPLQLTSFETYGLDIPADHPFFKVEYDHSYQIDVTTVTGKRYVSDFETVLPVPKMELVRPVESTVLVEDPEFGYRERDFIEFYLNTPLINARDATKTSLRWEFECTYAVTDNVLPGQPPCTPPIYKQCYITEITGLGDQQLWDANISILERLDDFLVYDEAIGHRYAEGYVLHIYQESLTLSALEYWNQVKSISFRTGDMFEAAPGKVKSNFKNVADPEDDRITGFFYATERDTLSHYISPASLGYPDTLCFPLPDSVIKPHICLDCLVEPGSTVDKPSYWPE